MVTWTIDDDGNEQRHMIAVWAGLGLLLVAAFALYLGTTRAQWPTAQAQILSVQLRCEMEAEGYTRSSRRAPSVIISCNQVEQFRADNANRRWNLIKRYSGDVRVERDDHAVTVHMGLGQSGGAPRVGDRFEVVQNPNDPSDVTFPERSMGETLVGLCLGGLGAFVLAIAFFWF